MPNIQWYCKKCSSSAKRALLEQSGCRGIHETASEPAYCPSGHGLMARKDGYIQIIYDNQWVVTGRERRR